jgi:hypothetical protein
MHPQDQNNWKLYAVKPNYMKVGTRNNGYTIPPLMQDHHHSCQIKFIINTIIDDMDNWLLTNEDIKIRHAKTSKGVVFFGCSGDRCEPKLMSLYHRLKLDIAELSDDNPNDIPLPATPKTTRRNPLNNLGARYRSIKPGQAGYTDCPPTCQAMSYDPMRSFRNWPADYSDNKYTK